MRDKVLIVDDVEINRSILGSILEDEYTIVEAENGKQALDIIEEQKDELSVILLDLVMPEMDGKQVLEELNKRKIMRTIPVLVISGENSYETERECFDLGISDYIAKPFNNVIIRKRVKNVARFYEYKLLAFLKARYDHFNGSKEAGLYILPCELIDHNGSTLKEVTVKLAHTCGYDEKFISWITEANKFYNTLVDRIVPGYPRDNAKECEAELGYTDNSMVVGEIFHLWCIDGDDIKALEEVFPAPKAGLNVLYVDSIVPYKQRKVKILNGTHTVIVPVAYLAGIDSVAETMADSQLGKYARDFMFDEVIPTINIPHDQMVAYANSVIERYENPFVHHLLMSIALNSVTKFKTRDLPTILQSIEAHNFPKHALFSLAALIAFYKGERVVNGVKEEIKLQDDAWALDFFKAEWANFDGSKEACAKIVKDFLGLEKHWELDLNKVEGVTEYVTNALYEIETNGMRQAIKNVIGD